MVHLLWAVPASLAVGVIWLVAAVANFKFGLSQGSAETFDFIFLTLTSSQLNAYAALAVDVLKIVMAIAAGVALSSRKWVPAALCGALFGLCLIWSSQAAVGYVLSERDAAVDGREQTADQWGAMKAEYDEAVKARSMVPVARPESIVRADMAASEADWLFQRTKACTDATAPESRAFCEKHRGIQSELAAAIARSGYDKRIEKLRGELDSRKRVTHADSLVAATASVMGTAKSNVVMGRSLAWAGLIEAISAFGLAAIWGTFAAVRRDEKLAAMPRPAAFATPDGAKPAMPPHNPTPPRHEPAPEPPKPGRKRRTLSGMLAEIVHPSRELKVVGGIDHASQKPEVASGPAQGVLAISGAAMLTSPASAPENAFSDQARLNAKLATKEVANVIPIVQLWIDDRWDERDGNAKLRAKAAYEDFDRWCAKTGFDAISHNSFGRAMKAMGYAARHTKHGMVYDGARLTSRPRPQRMVA